MCKRISWVCKACKRTGWMCKGRPMRWGLGAQGRHARGQGLGVQKDRSARCVRGWGLQEGRCGRWQVCEACKTTGWARNMASLQKACQGRVCKRVSVQDI